ncbi:hypothetical protein SAMN05443582_104348 [Phyllobacterium sp. OV277]|nr:hypothetical protein SAMN05443582_104348 [Phyllobacterium sp. OV277]
MLPLTSQIDRFVMTNDVVSTLYNHRTVRRACSKRSNGNQTHEPKVTRFVWALIPFQYSKRVSYTFFKWSFRLDQNSTVSPRLRMA